MTDWGWATPDNLRDLATDAAAPSDGDPRTIRAPATGDTLGTVPTATPAAVTTTSATARDAQVDWAERSIDERVEIVARFHDLVLDRRGDLADVVQAETGKARRDAMEEVLDVAINARYYANRADSLLTPDRRRGALPLLTKTREHHQPLGVVALITPWNYPLTLAISDAIPALLAGNTVVLKPDESTPYSALLGVRLLREAGLPADAFYVTPGPGETLGDPLIEESDFVGFTGSTAVGRSVAERAGRELTPCSLELGGKNPLLVLDDVDVDDATEPAVRSCFANAGQLCVSTERAYVHDAVYDEFLDAFATAASELRLGTGTSWAYDVGSLTPVGHADAVHEAVEGAVDAGAEVVVGGRKRPDVGPNVYEPTVLTDVPRDAQINVAETFGPVVAVHRVDTVQEALDRGNDSPYGLHATVLAGDADRGERVATHLDCGTVSVNDAYPATWASVDAPMGGTKDSGLGRRHGSDGLLKYTDAQTVSVQRGPTIGPGDRLSAKAWSGLMTRALRFQKTISGWRR